MKRIQRYFVELWDDGDDIIDENEEGEWCRAEDVTQLETENKRLREILFENVNCLKEELGHGSYTEEEFNQWLEQELKER